MNKGFVFGELFQISCIWAGQGCTLVTHETNAQQYVSVVCLHHFYHILFACRSQEEFTDSNVSCRVTSRPKNFLISLQFFCYMPTSSFVIFVLLSSFVKCIYIYIYIYFTKFTCIYFIFIFDDLKKKRRLLVLAIFWGRGLATLHTSALHCGSDKVLLRPPCHRCRFMFLPVGAHCSHSIIRTCNIWEGEHPVLFT